MLHQRIRGTLSIGALALGLAWGQSALATITSTFSEASFNALVGGLGGVTANTIDFESVTPGTVVEGSTLQGVTFSSALGGGYVLAVSDTNGVGDSNALGSTNNGGTTTSTIGFGESVTFNFSQPTHAFGLYVTANSPAFDFRANDVLLDLGGGAVLLNNQVGDIALTFLGIVDDVNTYTTATVSFNPAIANLYPFRLDNLGYTTPSQAPGPQPGPEPGPSGVPEPPLLMVLGLALLAAGRFGRLM